MDTIHDFKSFKYFFEFPKIAKIIRIRHKSATKVTSYYLNFY